MRYLQAWKIFAMIAMGLLYQIMDGLNFTTMVKVNKPDYKRWEGIECAFYTSFFRVTSFGSAPYLGTSYNLFKRGIPLSEGVAISAVNYSIHKGVIALICFAFGLYSRNTLFALGEHYFIYFLLSLFLVIPIAIVLIGFCTSTHFHQLILNILHSLDKKKKHADQIDRVRDQLTHMKIVTGQQMKNKKRLPIMIVRHIVKQIAIYSIPYFVLYGQIDCDIVTIIALTAVIVSIAGVIPSPGGIGSTEFAFVLLMSGLAANEKILSAALLYRFFTFYFPGLIGGIMILFMRMIHYENKIKK